MKGFVGGPLLVGGLGLGPPAPPLKSSPDIGLRWLAKSVIMNELQRQANVCCEAYFQANNCNFITLQLLEIS